MDSLFKSPLPDTAANEFGPTCKVFRVIADRIRSEIPPVDIAEVMDEITAGFSDGPCVELDFYADLPWLHDAPEPQSPSS